MENVHIMVDKRCTDTGGGYQCYYYDIPMEVVPTWTEKDFLNESIPAFQIQSKG